MVSPFEAIEEKDVIDSGNKTNKSTSYVRKDSESSQSLRNPMIHRSLYGSHLLRCHVRRTSSWQDTWQDSTSLGLGYGCLNFCFSGGVQMGAHQGQQQEAVKNVDNGVLFGWGKLPFFPTHVEKPQVMALSRKKQVRRNGELVYDESQVLTVDDSNPPRRSIRVSKRIKRKGAWAWNESLSEVEAFEALDHLFPGAVHSDDSSQLQSIYDRIHENLEHQFDFSSGRKDENAIVVDEGLQYEPTSTTTQKLRRRFKLGKLQRRLISGAIAGAVSRTAVAPLETLRTHLMVGRSGKTIGEVWRRIIERDGWTGLFRGNKINILRVAPSKAVELSVYDSVKNMLKSKEGEFVMPVPASVIAGSCAGISSTITMYPLELVKTRLTIQGDQYRGFVDAFQQIVANEGFGELYRGLVPSVVGVIPYAGASYYAYDKLRSVYQKMWKTEHIGNLETLLIGSAAAAIASTATFPLEIARKQMQMGALQGRVVYKSALDALSGILREEGIQGLYRGLGPSCLKLVPAAGISFMCYEALKSALPAEEDEEEAPPS